MELNVRRIGPGFALLVGLGLTACDGGAKTSGQPSEPSKEQPTEPSGAESAATNSEVQRWRQSLRQALDRLDTSTADGRRELHAALRREWEAHRAQLDTLGQEMRAATAEQRAAALAKARELTDQLGRRLDDLEGAGAEQWGEFKAGAVEQAERLRLELDRLLADKSATAPDQR